MRTVRRGRVNSRSELFTCSHSILIGLVYVPNPPLTHRLLSKSISAPQVVRRVRVKRTATVAAVAGLIETMAGLSEQAADGGLPTFRIHTIK